MHAASPQRRSADARDDADDADDADKVASPSSAVKQPVATITPYRDGPLILRGAFAITDVDGTVIDPGRATVALCRCGRSAVKPFCDGSHRLTDFHAPSGDARQR